VQCKASKFGHHHHHHHLFNINKHINLTVYIGYQKKQKILCRGWPPLINLSGVVTIDAARGTVAGAYVGEGAGILKNMVRYLFGLPNI